MLRKIHSWTGLLGALLVSFLAITGAYLAVEPLLDQLKISGHSESGTLAELASRVADKQPGVDRLVRKANGQIIAYRQESGSNHAVVVDPETGDTISSYVPSLSFGFMTELHRSMLNGTSGKAAAGFGAGMLLVLSLSGLFMLARRCGGLRNLFHTSQGSFLQRLHTDIAKWSMIGLIISAASGAYMSLATFGFVADGAGLEAPYPAQVLGTQPMPIGQLRALAKIAISDLRELIFPFQGDTMDAFMLISNEGQGYIDQASGELISYTPNTFGKSLYETIYMLHTGQGGGFPAAILALCLGLSALCIPVLGISGFAIWRARTKLHPKTTNNSPLSKADVVVLVGSEGNTSWSFAATLVRELHEAGKRVHLAPMNALASAHFSVGNMVILTSTYGDGEAPSNADKFLPRLSKLPALPNCKIAVLGFGDSQFSDFCGFAVQVEHALTDRGCNASLPLTKINRQCPQAFSQWGVNFGRAFGLDLDLNHQQMDSASHKLVLSEIVASSHFTEREIGSDIAVLRFSVERAKKSILSGLIGKTSSEFGPGDLVGILPPGNYPPRFYSIASSSKNGFLEICVKRHQFGICSNYLHSLKPGDHIEGFIKANPAFKTQAGRAPVILVGAGTGMAPLAGFARENTHNRQMHLYWGGQSPFLDFVYKSSVVECLQKNRLTRAVVAYSKGSNRQYVQDKLRENAESIRSLTQQGAQFLICGGRPMATGVHLALDEILKPNGLSVDMLRAEKRYLEDVY